jgi:hypothetical protein
MTPDRPLLAPLTTTLDEQMFEDCYNQDIDRDDDDWLDSDADVFEEHFEYFNLRDYI